MTHPSGDELRGLLAENLPPGERERVEGHVNQCEACLGRLDAMQRAGPRDVRLLAELLLHPPEGVESAAERNGHVPPAEPVPGWPTFGDYDVLVRVGVGGMGEVYKARHRRTRRVVALKTLPPALDLLDPDNHERLSRFRTEAEAVSRLQHPNIVSVYDVGDQEGRPYFTMEWVAGGSLAEFLAGTPQPQRLAAEWVLVLARAVQHVHERGVLHRDLKPGNILLAGVREEIDKETGRQGDKERGNNLLSPLTSDPRPLTPALKISDFGVAKLLDRPAGPAPTRRWLGTPEYMAPEQAADGLPVGPAVDVYALGVLLYELLTGRPPFKADEPLETLRQVRDEEPVPPGRLRPRLDRDLETVCLKCLHKDPQRRYGSAAALAGDLERWLAGAPILARPLGLRGRAVRWARRHPERAGLVGLGIGVLLALVVGLFWQWWAGQVGYTRQLAASADHQLLLVKYAVGQTAQDAGLRNLLADPAGNRDALRGFLETTKRDFLRWFTRPGENPPIINWFVMDPGGTILADSYEDPRSVGKNYAWRDYYTGLLGADAPSDRAAVYVSRVYRSEQDGRFKFTVMTRVWGPDGLVGLLGASLAVGSGMVALDMGAEWPGARVVGPMERPAHRGEGRPGDEPASYVVILDRCYGVPGQHPREVGPGKHAVLDTFARDPTLRQEADGFSVGGCLVTFARVGDSHFVAVVERAYPGPVSILLRFPLASLAVFAAVVAGTAALERRWVRRRRPATG